MSTIHFYIILFSTHILTRRMTWHIWIHTHTSCFSTHILTRRMTVSYLFSLLPCSFQLTSSQGGWQIPCCLSLMEIFFQLTSSQGGWRSTCICHLSVAVIFNSHPHKEDDGTFMVSACELGFSTHILTRRMTLVPICLLLFSVFQLTSSQGGWQCTIIATKGWYRLFNSHPHKEDDQFLTWPLVLRLFSTHILTRRMTSSRLDTLEQLAFQLTSSQGGWLASKIKQLLPLFSTHILTRRMTCVLLEYDNHTHFSTHILTRRMTITHFLQSQAFYFSTHILTRRMTIIPVPRLESELFQLTSSQGGWHVVP